MGRAIGDEIAVKVFLHVLISSATTNQRRETRCRFNVYRKIFSAYLDAYLGKSVEADKVRSLGERSASRFESGAATRGFIKC